MTERHQLNSFRIRSWKTRHHPKRINPETKRGVLMTPTPASSAIDVSEARLKWNDNDRGALWKPTDGSGIPVDVKAKSNTPGKGLGVFT